MQNNSGLLTTTLQTSIIQKLHDSGNMWMVKDSLLQVSTRCSWDTADISLMHRFGMLGNLKLEVSQANYLFPVRSQPATCRLVNP